MLKVIAWVFLCGLVTFVFLVYLMSSSFTGEVCVAVVGVHLSFTAPLIQPPVCVFPSPPTKVTLGFVCAEKV